MVDYLLQISSLTMSRRFATAGIGIARASTQQSLCVVRKGLLGLGWLKVERRFRLVQSDPGATGKYVRTVVYRAGSRLAVWSCPRNAQVW
jgi:hypothetical protein